MLDKIFLGLLIFVPATLAAHYFNISPLIVFFISALSIVPLAKFIGEATEELSIHTGPALGGFLSATFGNAAEHTSAITMAVKNKMDLATQISIGSATQIVMFVMPALILVSLMFKTQMSLVFNTFELIVIVLSVMIANLIVEDGETNWFEGLQLIVAYVIIAVAFFLHP